MNEEQQKRLEQAERQRQRVRRQNEQAKQNWDCVSLRLPKGTKDRIKAQGESVNGLLNRLVLEWLEQQEKPKENKPDYKQIGNDVFS